VPASCRSERAEALAQETLVDRRRDTHLMLPTRRACYAIGPRPNSAADGTIASPCAAGANYSNLHPPTPSRASVL
jgi:hypothetical protein